MGTPTRSAEIVEVDGKQLKLSHLDKVLYPATGFTKAQVIEYYVRIGPVLLKHLRRHPVTMKRYPEGVAGEFFFEKRCPVYRPGWMHTSQPHASSSERGDVSYCVIDSLPSLVWTANLASLEFHTLLATPNHLDRPTTMVFDLDPGPGATLLDCAWLARELKQRLDALKLHSLIKTSGGKGLHICVPLNTPVTYDQTRELSRHLAVALTEQFPDRVTANMRKGLREGKIFIDWSQNTEHKTTVCVYSLRARATPSVSTPITWQELTRAKTPARLTFSPEDVIARVKRLGDLFAPALTLKQRLPPLPASAAR